MDGILGMMSLFNEIYAAEYLKAIRFARNRCNLRDDMAEQIVSDTFLDLHKALGNEIEIENLTAWLRRTIQIRYAEFLRHKLRVKRGGRLQRHPLLLWGSDLAVEHPEFAAVDAADTLQSVWIHLTKAEQRIAEMVFMQELNQTEIADKLSITVRTVERRVNRVRNRLRILLSDTLL